MRGIIDRFEENFAVVELDTGKMLNIKRAEVPEEAQEGDVLDISSSITVNREETEKRKAEIKRQTEGLWSD